MTDTEKGHYVVFEDWIELGKFDTQNAAMVFQEFRRAAHPCRKVTLFFEQGNNLALIEPRWPLDPTARTKGSEMLQGLKGGGKRMINGRENRQAPVKKFTAGAVSAALWTNKTTLKDGRSIDTLSVSLDRRYKDSEGEWKSSSSFKESDIPKAMLVLAKAYEFMTAKDDGDSDGPAA